MPGDHRSYLADGLGFIIGDGALNYWPESIVEAFYSVPAIAGFPFMRDYQHIRNPTYNRERVRFPSFPFAFIGKPPYGDSTQPNTKAAASRLLRGAWHCLALLGLLFVLVTATPLTPWWARVLAGAWDDPRGDVLIVLGGNVQDDGLLGQSSYWRAVYAVRAWREGGWREVIITGGGRLSTPIALPIRDFLISSGVPASAIRVETRSNSTRENALFTKEMLVTTPGRKVLLSSDYQMFRAIRTFRRAGLDVIPRPVPDASKQGNSWIGRWSAFETLVAETGKICYYYVRGWL